MSGIVGFIHHQMSEVECMVALNAMQQAIHHRNSYSSDKFFIDKFLCGTRTHNQIIQNEPQPYEESGIYVWLDGEFYNQNELLGGVKLNKTDPQIMLMLFKESQDFSFLKQIDGIYASVIYDTNKSMVYLINDRYGLRYLYWSFHKNQLLWASEVKAILAYPDYCPKIDRVALQQFIHIGYMLENRTWIDSINLLPPGTVLSFDMKSKSLQSIQYWWWNDIKPFSGIIDENEIVDILGNLFINAVNRRSRETGKIGLALSGGLDSRALLAAFPDNGHALHTITFGMKNCDDLKIADRATQVKGAVHHTINLDSDNWLKGRLMAIWLTDGQTDMQHMHGISVVEQMHKLFPINLNGLAGGLIMGGSYILNESYLDTITQEKKSLIANFYKCSPSLIDDFNKYIGLRKTDFYFLQNRIRRFTQSIKKYSQVLIEERAPFFDNKLIEFVYSLPDKYRYQHYIYKKMLLKFFPKFYKAIPWQKTGYPIAWSEMRVKVAEQLHTSKLMRTLLNYFGIRSNHNHYKDYANYAKWIRQEPALAFFNNLLCADDALYPEYIERELVLGTLQKHMNGQNLSDALCRYITFEIWLQQVFNGIHRNESNINITN
jgi:asparagine synthase (glutamine-hydrolysing)